MARRTAPGVYHTSLTYRMAYSSAKTARRSKLRSLRSMRGKGVQVNKRIERTFVVCVDNTAVLAFSAANQSEARQLCKEAWLREDLRVLKSEGYAAHDR